MLPWIAAKLASPLVRYAVIGGIAGILGFGLAWKLQGSTINEMMADYAEARTKAVQQARDEEKRIAEVTLASALEAAKNEREVVTNTVEVIKYVTKYVKEVSGCPSDPMLRMHDAAALGTNPANLTEGPGQPDGTPGTITTVAFSEAIAENYGVCRKTAARLTGLQDWVRKACEK